MGSKIPRPVRREVIRKCLQGQSRDQIANEVGIGAGTVSGIVKESRKDDPEFVLPREVGLNLKNRGMSIESFGALIRLREVLEVDIRSGEAGESEADIYGLDEVAKKKMESLIISMEVFCFKQNLSVKQFIDILNELYWEQISSIFLLRIFLAILNN